MIEILIGIGIYLLGCVCAAIFMGFADAITNSEKSNEDYPLCLAFFSWIIVFAILVYICFEVFVKQYVSKLYNWSYDKFKRK